MLAALKTIHFMEIQMQLVLKLKELVYQLQIVDMQNGQKYNIKGVKALQKAYGVPTARVLGHTEAAVPKGRKIDPNFSMAEFRTALNK